MKIASKHDAALALLLALTDEVHTLASISVEINLSVSYLEQLATKLRGAKLIESVRGPGGGYRLTRPLNQITVGDIFTAIGTETNRQGFGLFDEIQRRLKHVALSDLGKGVQASCAK
ncbi:iron-sulfur cluster regulator [Buttiauxella gaviniae ATCC 51604]|uniref:Iron-sulfur cluster regulator n=1 Tax=Buttiauxella gaviniae ATCC 51604 TaxID=1354253 RepID=A0A1B7HQI2_9ENTR|nr:Rrf2 family transcriptional regulator [Buttiauxella gaviniae]OAT17915.1 iron-sulfur cluster regulator [Buttiauxella gaviniae ATCC 51604]